MTPRLGIDIGGSGIKAALIDTASGELLTDRRRLETPSVSTPANLAATVRELVSSFDYTGPIGCCFPAVIRGGEARTAGNIDPAWIGTHVGDLFGEATGHPYRVVNDADAAAVAEMQLGAGRGLGGLVLTITVGTGLGSGMFYDGVLVPNLEIGWMPSDMGMPMERWASDRARKANGLSWDEWGARFDYFLTKTARVFTPDHFILGGGASKKYDKYKQRIRVTTPVHLARFRNNAGIIGAALTVADGTGPSTAG
jgi:polyphosphate glucokinase